jgi:hypothetical protein
MLKSRMAVLSVAVLSWAALSPPVAAEKAGRGKSAAPASTQLTSRAAPVQAGVSATSRGDTSGPRSFARRAGSGHYASDAFKSSGTPVPPPSHWTLESSGRNSWAAMDPGTLPSRGRGSRLEGPLECVPR